MLVRVHRVWQSYEIGRASLKKTIGISRDKEVLTNREWEYYGVW